MTSPAHRPRFGQRLLGLAATLLIALLVAGIPVLLIAIGATPWHTDLAELRTLLSSPDDGTLAMNGLAGVAWVAWLVVAASVLLEVVAQVRGLPTPVLPGLGGPQRALGHLVTVAALLFVATPTLVGAFPAPPAAAVATAPVHVPLRWADAEAAPLLSNASPVPLETDTPKAGRATIDYTVKRGDSLWKIADRLLGDGTRFPEIVNLNRHVLNGQPDFITAGTVLLVPDESPSEQPDTAGPAAGGADEYVVKPGDTLSAIAHDELGDPRAYPELFEASHDTVQPDGNRLTDPDLIRPGWTITVPDHAEPGREARPDVTEPEQPPAAVPSPATTPPQIDTATPQAEPATTSTAGTPDEATSVSPGWLLPGLTGGGAVLAALVLLAVRAHRNTQLRYRRPGQRIEPPPVKLRPVEKTAFVTGASLAAPVETLGHALLLLAGACQDEDRPLPGLVTAKLGKSVVSLLLADDADLPFPWTGEGREWSLDLTEPVDERRDVVAPFPLLVTVGQDTSGDLWLVNLEHLGVITLAGDSAHASALARHIAAELALNPWSVLVKVTLIGLGEELTNIDAGRLTYDQTGTHVIDAITGDLGEASENGWDDPDPFRVVITAEDGIGELASLLSASISRLGAAVVSLAAPLPESMVFSLNEHGRLRVRNLKLDLHAAGLSSDEAAVCTAIVDLTRESQPERIGPSEQAADGWGALADQAGALREELTDARDAGPAGQESLLPEPAASYKIVAATTVEDVEALAPIVPQETRRRVEEADPHLDEDLADWFDADNTRPRLWLLGPVNAQAHGLAPSAIAKRKPYFVELLAFLALHPDGSPGHAVSDAFSVATSRARTDLGMLRDWLGDNPRTGQPYLPQATKSPAYHDTGVRSYQVEGLLVDLDLFRRLRLRGEAKGAEGIADLKTTISLVRGVPFSKLREKGWSWLLDDERIHETITCSIVDTAHILTLHALSIDDLGYAREVAATACHAAPYDDICRLDLAKVLTTQGHHEAADRMLTDTVLNRTDDHLPPIEFSERTGDAISGRAWGASEH